MKASVIGGSDLATQIVMELSMEEARALRSVLGTDSLYLAMDRGVSRENSDISYHIYDKLDDVLLMATALEGI